MHRVGLGKSAGDQGVAGLVIGDALLLLAAEQALALLRAGDQALDPLLELGEADVRLAAAGRQQGRLVDEIGQVGADEARRHRRDLAEVDRLVERDGAGVDLEDLLAADQVGTVDDDLAVEAARPHQRRVERLGAIGRGQQDDASVGVEAVHLDQQAG